MKDENKILDANEVLKKIGEKSWKNLSEEGLKKYIKLSPNIDKKVQSKILSNLKENGISYNRKYTEALEIIYEFSIHESNNKSRKDTVSSINSIIEKIFLLSNNENIPFEEKQKLINICKELINEPKEVDKKNKEFLLEHDKKNKEFLLQNKIIEVVGNIATTAIGIALKTFINKNSEITDDFDDDFDIIDDDFDDN